MDRKQSRSPNKILKYKPNQFPKARFGNIKWQPTTTATNSNASSEENATIEEPTTGTDSSKIEKLKHRFD